ncbi:DNA repair protein XRCC4 isoform X1 [Colossoma macropomum]|uniref:DNA repair protein XRCC4 isoform X1 n=2 Tax=Colossoma macropomum TaxID=42526 RepID=UPI00186427AB|nr:DNA repair protein XRCC4 isoform X1 [Colossoma macropomum]
MKVTVRQIPIVSKPECTFYLKLEWAKDLGAGFVVLLCDGISAWSGEVSEDDVTREAQEMEMAREKYVYDLQLALTGEGQEAQSYSFHLAPEKAGGPMLQLSYEKVQSDVSFRLGMVGLLPVPGSTEVIRDLISHGLERSACFRAKNHHLLEENQRLRNEQEHITAEMERYVQGKETLEKDLYSRFVLVLNEKKAKIRALQTRIKQLQDTVEKEKQRRKKEAAGNGESCLADDKPEEESDYGSTTEEEREEDAKAPPLRPSNQVFISNPMDDSLNDTTDVAPNRKRRQRHLQQLESQNKRPALEQRQSSRNELPEEAKAEVQKAPVQDSPDPDDLFDNI